MDEFEFLRKMYARLSEARSLQAHDEKRLQPVKVGRKEVVPHSAFETAALMVEYSIRDYLALKAQK